LLSADQSGEFLHRQDQHYGVRPLPPAHETPCTTTASSPAPTAPAASRLQTLMDESWEWSMQDDSISAIFIASQIASPTTSLVAFQGLMSQIKSLFYFQFN
jgi:hypothetical protein